MKIVQINTTCGAGSTGRICVAVSELLTQNGVENYVLYASGHSNYSLGKKYMSDRDVKIQALKSRISGNYGFQSKRATKRLIAELERIAPDIVHLHNLHGHNVHLGELFAYLKAKRIKVFWTFHDCWAFTAYCPYYDITECNKWRTGCHDCPVRTHYSWFVDRSRVLYAQKKQLFTGMELTIITPSNWLADQVRQSFLKDYPVKVISNGIDLSVFSKRKSDFRVRYGIEDKYMLLGVAFNWGPRKGLDVFIRLAKRLDPAKFQIVLVGTNHAVDKQLPSNIISIHRTASQTELAEIYTAADLFVNPTREEVLGLTNLEAQACGTPVVTFCTGGSPECVGEHSGVVVARNDENALYNAIMEIQQNQPFAADNCRAQAAKFLQTEKFNEYILLYK